MSSNNKPLISVIIPVYNDTDRLQLCLEALDKQSLNKSDFQIIIIDNGSAQSILSETSKYQNLIVLKEPRSGSYIARNQGVMHARSAFLAFTDADCIPDNNWLERGLYMLQSNEHIGLIGGNIELFFNTPCKLTIAEIYEKHTAFQQRRYIEQYNFAATANMFSRKDVFNHVGLFNESLKSSGDKEWGQRVHRSQYQLTYAKNIIVKHPARFSLKELYSKNARVIGGAEALHSKKKTLFIIYYDLLNGMIPPIHDIKSIMTKDSSLYEKSIALGILLSMNLHSTFIRLRLRLGGQAVR